MSIETPTQLLLALTLSAVGLYGLHRLALRLEDQGLIYYLRTKPTGAASRGILEVQKFMEPEKEHVLIVRSEPRIRIHQAEGDPPRSGTSDS